MAKKVIIIGAGIGGIATAIRMAAKGYRVQVLEKNDFAGGKLAEIKAKGFRWDTGPSLFTLPALVDDLFILHGRKPSDYYTYNKLETICKYFYADGTIINAWQNVTAFADEVEQKTGVNQKVFLSYLKRSARIFDLTNPLFLNQSFHKIQTFLSRHFFKAILRWHQLDAFRTVHQANHAAFGNKHLTQLFDRYATYNGSNPYVAPATLNVIPHLEHHIGAYFPKQGMYQIITGLLRLCHELNIEIIYNCQVDKISYTNNKIKGVVCQQQFTEADIVISNADIVPTYKILNRALPGSQKKFERSTSALIFYWGINCTHGALDLHNILFSGNYKAEFDALFKSKTVYHDPSVYIFISAKKVRADAPDNSENWFTMINVPENNGQNWDKLIREARQHIITKINHTLNTNIESHIVYEKVFDPRDIEQRTSAFHGSLYGNSSNHKFAAFARHSNFSSSIKNLYFVGGTVHPGGGIPLCLNSARIVADMI